MYGKDRVSIVDKREMLRVKVKSLAAEAKIIRREEQKTYGELRDQLHWHRIYSLRQEARATHLAYGLIKGRTMKQMEQTSRTKPNMKRINEMCKKYGPINMPLLKEAA